MFKKVFVAMVIVGFMAGSAFAGEMPPKFKKCKACHGLPGSGKGKVGPNLDTSEWPLEQWIEQVNKGSKRENRPPKQEKYAKKKMKKLKGYTDAEIEEIYNYVQEAKK